MTEHPQQMRAARGSASGSHARIAAGCVLAPAEAIVFVDASFLMGTPLLEFRTDEADGEASGAKGTGSGGGGGGRDIDGEENGNKAGEGGGESEARVVANIGGNAVARSDVCIDSGCASKGASAFQAPFGKGILN